jgi:hypothetical protein
MDIDDAARAMARSVNHIISIVKDCGPQNIKDFKLRFN